MKELEPIRTFYWLSDLHLNFLRPAEMKAFFAGLVSRKAAPFGLLISGDIADGSMIEGVLDYLASDVPATIWFVLGNHDFYHSSIRAVREVARRAAKRSSYLCWLTETGPMALTERVGIVGHDGWADGRLGDFAKSKVRLNDFALIEELKLPHGERRRRKLAELGDEAAEHFRRVLPEAIKRFQTVIILTHVPPFREATLYAGKISSNDYLPYFGSQAAGAVIREYALANPQHQFVVLCGHTHSVGEVRILPNLVVLVAGAEYERPGIQRVLQFDWYEPDKLLRIDKCLRNNAIICKKCGTIAQSTHVHHFQRCDCGAVAADGGLEYLKRVGRGYKEISEFDDGTLVGATEARLEISLSPVLSKTAG